MPTITLKGQPLFYFERTVKDSPYPPLVLIHGAGGTHLDWPPQLRRLRGVTVYALDLPGHGQSASEGRDSVAEYAAMILDWLDAMQLGPVIVMGHSMGGAIALRMALDAPEQAAGLVLVGTSARMRVSPALLDDTLHNPEAAVQFVATYGYGPATSDKIKSLGSKGLRATSARVLHGDYLACDIFDVRSELARITAPVLIVGSSQDQMVPPKFVESLASGLPNAELRWIETCGHMIPVEAPEELARLVQNWLAHFAHAHQDL